MLDANSRELFIAACLILPIIGIGLYPKFLMQSYDATTVQIAADARNAIPTIAGAPTQLPHISWVAPPIVTEAAMVNPLN
jgi:NAD(P)H-quinone oxidoreductase subunit 4